MFDMVISAFMFFMFSRSARSTGVESVFVGLGAKGKRSGCCGTNNGKVGRRGLDMIKSSVQQGAEGRRVYRAWRRQEGNENGESRNRLDQVEVFNN